MMWINEEGYTLFKELKYFFESLTICCDLRIKSDKNPNKK